MTKILYVDDEEVNLMLFELNLNDKYEILTAPDGLNGLEQLSKHRDIKVVVSDMRMPLMNGLEFISKAKERFPEINYYILTGFDINREIEEALQTGLIRKYFRKPFNLNLIDQEIQEALDE